MLLNYFKIAWRNITTSKLHSFINIVGLSLGMAVAMLIGLWLHDELSFDKNFKNYDRIAQVIQNVTNNGEVETWMATPYPLAEELRKNYGSDFKHISMSVGWGDHILTIGDKKLKQTGGWFENDFPEMMTLKMRYGNWNSLDDPTSVILSESAAKAYFGNDNPIGKLIQVDEYPVVKVSGVYEDFPRNSTFADLNFISPWEFLYNNEPGFKQMSDPWRPNFAALYVQLNENADIDKVSAKIKDAKLKKQNAELQKKKPALFLHPMSDWHLYSEFKNGVNVGGAIQNVWLFGIIGAFVLLLACINFMNLSTARSEKRAKEVGIRKTIGSVRKQLILQFFSESLLTVTFAFVFSILLVQFALPFFNQVADKQMIILWDNPVFWMMGAAFILITALVAGSYPAFYLSSFKPVKVLKGTFKAGRYAALPRKVLVVLQFTVSVTLIIGILVVFRQIEFAKHRPVGYMREGLVNIPLMNAAIHDHFDAVKEELIQSGAISAMAESGNPTTGLSASSSGFSWQGKDPNLSIDFAFVSASYDYGKTIGWQIKEGRDFSKDFSTDTSAFIINEAAAHYMNLENPVGQTIMWFDAPYTVVGVVKDMIFESPYKKVEPIIYTASTGGGNVAILKINPASSVKDALHKIETVFKKFNPDQPFEYQFVDEEYAKKFGREVRLSKLAGFFAALAIIISCLGLFGLTSFVAEQRKKEISVRKVLGASVLSVWNLLSKDFILLVAISFLIAMPLAYYLMYHWLNNYQYRTQLSWWIFAVAGIGALLITLATVSFQAIRAAVANPVNALKNE
ncbi:MAG: ABC transporter permease [Saprospiraceae bacterium]|nr:ABC transporter permease [Saprospiraceae bacterium]